MKLSKGFSVKGNIDKLYELTEKYVSAMKYKVANSVKPTLLVLNRGSGWGSALGPKVEDMKTTLTITFSQRGEDTHILCDYDVVGYAAIFTTSDKSALESEVEKLKNFLLTAT